MDSETGISSYPRLQAQITYLRPLDTTLAWSRIPSWPGGTLPLSVYIPTPARDGTFVDPNLRVDTPPRLEDLVGTQSLHTKAIHCILGGKKSVKSSPVVVEGLMPTKSQKYSRWMNLAAGLCLSIGGTDSSSIQRGSCVCLTL